MWKLTQNYSSANNDVENRDREVNNPCLKIDSSDIAEGSQKENKNESLKKTNSRDSTRIIEQEDSPKKVRVDTNPTEKVPSNHKQDEENKILKEPSVRYSTQIMEQKDSQKEVKTDTGPTKKNLLTTKESLKRKQRKGLKKMKNGYMVKVGDTAVHQIWISKSLG